ncbi:MAG: hypothetical protein BGO41_04255 [Clostridiales bacterium 38-18]|nr:MAG: hypothetical protein BGO41_04255 [Clostridiales bacterium 38-18]
MKSSKGQSLVEFALVMPLLMLILIGIIEFGFMFSGYLTLTNASREAARVISLGGTYNEAEARIEDVVGILNSEDVIFHTSVDVSTLDRGDSITVTLSYPYHFLTPFLTPLFGGELKLESSATLRVE